MMRASWLRTLVSAGLFLLGGPVGLSAQAAPHPEGDGGGAPAAATATQGADYVHALAPRVRAVRASSGIDLDGRLDEGAWADAPPITEFIQQLPNEGQPATEPTDVRIVYDDDAVYIGAMMYDSQPITTRLTRRDAGRGDFDFLLVKLDSYHDHETAYQFTVNPSGAYRDMVSGGGGGGGGGDSSWDPVWTVRTQITDEGWSAEMRIPFSQLRFRPDREQVWGIEIERSINRSQEQTMFPFVPTLDRGGPSRYAHMDGIEGIRPGRRLELLPYVAGRSEYLRLDVPSGIDFGNPYRSGSDYFGEAGLDLKYRVSSNVTLDATVNPDFGQVELDPSVINLTAFETRYQERRPFFVEGADIFRFGEGGPQGSTGQGPQLLYSRRIGRAPTGGAPSSAIFSDEATATTILGAAKLTGRLGSGWSLGFLEAATAKETAHYVDALDLPGESVIEPAANYFVGRVRKLVGDGETRFGMIGAAVNRDMSGTGMEGLLHSSAYSGGFDFAHEWGNRTYRIASTFTASRVAGDPAAILRTQRSSTRYYQRPDATHLSIDSLATSLSGYYAMVDIAKQAGAFGAKLALAAASPGYEVNDLGFQSASDRIIMDTNFSYTHPNPGRYLRRWDTRGSPDAVWNYAGDRIFGEINGDFNVQFLNYWGAGIRLAYDPANDDDRLTRGGPMAKTPSGFSGTFNMNTDERRSTNGRLNYRWSTDKGGSWSHSVGLGVNLKPSETLEIQFGPAYTRRHASAQYVTSVADSLASRTYGRRYIFAGLDQTTISLETRVNVTFSPTLSLQLYAEPFISTGNYRELKEFERPNTFSFLEYGTDIGTITDLPNGGYYLDPDGSGPAEHFSVPAKDFSYRSLLGNAVLRWEWREGSTLYLVWQQRRIDSRTGYGTTGADPWVGSFDLHRDVSDMFGTRPDNIFVVKVSYWLNP